MHTVTTPLVGISCNIRKDRHHIGHSVGHRFVAATIEIVEAVPVLLPAAGPEICVETLLTHLDGLILTGGASNIEPHHYGDAPRFDDTLRDPGRDNLVLPLIRGAIERGMPLFGICRGIQELNVALGGTLHQYLHEVPGRHDHRRQRELPMAEAMNYRHTLRLTPGGVLARLTGAETVRVNSLHGQGIDRLAERLQVEGVSEEDGTVEAVSVKDAPGFALGVQWHAEWRIDAFPLHRMLFRAFARSVKAYAQARRTPEPTALAAE